MRLSGWGGLAAALIFMSMGVAGARAASAPCPLSVDEVEVALDGQYRRLMESRGAPATDYMSNARDGIDDYLSYRQRPDDDGARLLLIYVTAGDVACVLPRSSRDRDELAGYLLPEPVPTLMGDIDRLLGAVQRPFAGRSGTLPTLRAGQSRGPTPAGGEVTPPLEVARRAVARQLFPPEIVARLAEASALYVVPAVNIGTVPFALLDPDEDGVPLLDAMSITIAPSLNDVAAASVLVMGAITGRVSVVGDPDATADPDWDFPRLPAARREAEAVAHRFGTLPVLGSDATVAQALAVMREAEYIHIAAHGFSDALAPLDGSFLAFTGGRLTARQIQDVPVAPYAIAVLSACQTGLGGIHEAGIIGLARAFLIAGSSAVVASLWNVDDEATAHMMTVFADLLGPNDPAEALRRAQLETRRKWPDPAQWGSFITFGHRIVVE